MKTHLRLLALATCWTAVGSSLQAGAQAPDLRIRQAVPSQMKPAAEQQAASAGQKMLPFALPMGAVLRPASFVAGTAGGGVAGRPTAAPVVTDIFGTRLIKNNGTLYQFNEGLSGTDADGDLNRFRFNSLPANGILYVANATLTQFQQVTVGMEVQAQQAQFIGFAATSGSAVGTRSFAFDAVDAQGTHSAPANYYFQVVNNFPPTASDFTTATLISNGLRQPLRDLAAWGFSDSDGTISSFKFTALPSASTGTLYVNGVAAVANQTYAVANSALLSFQPAAGYSGTSAIASFTATDNLGATSGEAQLGIPVNKATCGQASVFDFTLRASGEDWKTNRTATVPNSTVTVSNNLNGTSGYSSSAAAGETSFTTDLRAGSPGYALDWFTDYTTTANVTSTANFYFNRPLKNFSFTMGDLDKGTVAEGSAFVDDVTFNGYRADGSVVQLDPGDVSLAPNGNNFFSGNNRITGRTNPATGSGSTTGPDGNVTITFTDAIVRLELVYKNLQTEIANPGTQAVYISAFTWCEEADLTTTVSGNTYANVGNTVTYTVTTTNNSGLDDAHNVVPTVQLPTGLSGVNVTNGSYNSTTGLVTFNTTALLTSGSSVNNTVSFTMPNSTVTGTARNTADTSDPIIGSNNGTQATAQITTVVNAAPTALSVNNATVPNTVGQQPILPLQATDPQGNATVASFTITSLPVRGTLQLNGTNVTLNQVIPAAQADQLTYSPDGNAASLNTTQTFQFSATDDLGLTSSNLGTVRIPIGAATGAVDFAVTQQVTLGSYLVGQNVTYRIVGTSSGIGAGVAVNFVLPTGLTFQSSTVSVGTYNSTTGVWTIGATTAGASYTMTVTARVDQVGDLTTNAIISATTADSNPDNNVASQNINVADNAIYSEDFEGRIIDYCAATTGFTVSDATSINGREVLSSGTVAAGTTVSYTTPLLQVTGGTVSFNMQSSAVGGTGNNRPQYTVTLLNENGTTAATYGPTFITLTANTTTPISVSYTGTGVRKVQISFVRGNGNTTFLLDDVQVTNATSASRAKDGSSCASNVAPTVTNITAPRMSDQAGATSIPALSGTDSDGSIASYVVTALPDATQGVLYLNGVAVTSGQVLTPAQAIQLTFDPTAGYFGDAKFTYQAYDNSNTISSNVGTVTIPVAITSNITGIIFDDVNYGGGAGRTYSAANTSATGSGFSNNAIGRSNATVELYDETGALVGTTTTNASGAYTFANKFPGDYTVRVVNSTVTSVRATTSTPTGLLPVQTYITGDVNRVGGENPLLRDAAVNTGSQNLSALTTSTATPQSIIPVTVLNRPTGTPSYDFGFNFDAIVNTNPSGQGSLAQFISNSNGLANTNLSQAGLTAGRETSVFMIADGRTTDVPAGLRSGLNGGASNGQATITITAASGALPAVTDAGTTIDGGRQTAVTGDTNPAVAESTTGPEVTINFNGQAGRSGGALYVTGGNFTLSGVGLTGATNGTDQGLRLDGAGVTGAVIQNSTFYSNGANIGLNALSGVTVTGNVIRNSTRTDADGIEFSGVTGSTISNNQLVNNAAMGLDFVSGTNSSNTITGNLFKGNGTLNGVQKAGLAIRTVATGNIISLNTFTSNVGDGIVAITGSNNTFTQNSFNNNGNLGIDLANGGTADGDGVTKNASGRTAASGANGLLTFPVITQARINGGNLLLAGYAPAGAKVEIYVASVDPTNFGEGQTYLTFRTEGNATDDAATGRKSYSALMNGIDQGSETNANMFQFSIPTSSLTSTQLAALTAANARLTATATVTGSGTSEFSGVAPVQNGPLPVTLVSFTAQSTGQDVKLAWSTAQEINNDHFVVERSFDGQVFEAIQQVKGQGTKTSTTTYSLVDAQVAAKVKGSVAYYRLRQVDLDGTEAFSSVQAVSFSVASRTNVEVYPNPATSLVDARLDLSGLAQGSYQVMITDMAGRAVRTFAQPGGSNLPLDVTALPSGSYLIQVQGNSQTFVKRLVKE